MASTARPEVVGGIGGFGGFFAFDPGRYEKPLLVSTTDGVGTKSEIARLVGRYDTIGLDCVAMSVDDLAVVRGRAAVLPRLHLGRPQRPGDDRGDRVRAWWTGAARRGVRSWAARSPSTRV